MLESAEDKGVDDGLGDIAGVQQSWMHRLCKLEASSKQMQEIIDRLSLDHGTEEARCIKKVDCVSQLVQGLSEAGSIPVIALASLGPANLNCLESSTLQSPKNQDQNQEEHLQTKTIPNEVVRQDLEKWRPSM